MYHSKLLESSGERDSLDLCFNLAFKEDSSKLFELSLGNHFGASDFLRIVDTEYLGDIVAGEKGAKILVIPKPDQII